MKFRYPLNRSRPPLSAHELDPGDPSARETRAILELLRAVNTGKLVAYTGSGVSRIYGYPSWSEFARKTAETVVHALDLILNDPAATLHANRTAELDAIRTSELDAIRTELDRRNKNWVNAKSLKDHELLALINALLGSLEHVVLRAPASKTGDTAGGARAKIGGVATQQESESSARLPSALSQIRNAIKDQFKRPPRLPVGVARAKLDDSNLPASFLDDLSKESFVPADLVPAIRLLLGPSAFELPRQARPLKAWNLASRRGDIDPIHTLIRDFNIDRLATLNYDLEIEACLEDLDYPYQTLTEDDHAAGRTGATGKSTTLKPDITPALITFAANLSPRPTGHHVVHIHGSAKDASSMVVTQDQYNRLYVAPNRHTATFQDALYLLFNGNPILFVGVGMTEDDVMRPMRNLLFERGNDLSLFALLANDESAGNSVAGIHHNKSRYGVDTVVYGRSKGDIPQVWNGFTGNSDIAHPTLTRFNKAGSHPSGFRLTDVIPLHMELDNLKSLATLVGHEAKMDSSSGALPAIARLKTIAEEPWRYPRVCSTRYYGLIRSLPKDPNPEIDARVGAFISDDLDMVARSVACDDMLLFLNAQANIWRNQWKLIVSEKQEDLPNIAHAYHGVDVDSRYLDQVDLAATEHLNLPNINKGDAVTPGLRILRFADGRGKGSLFASVARMFDQGAKARSAHYAFSAASTLRFDALERMIEAAEIAESSQISYLFVHNVESLMDRRHLTSRKRAVNYVTELAFRRLARLAYRGQALVVFTCSNSLTEQYLYDLACFEAKKEDSIAGRCASDPSGWILRTLVTGQDAFFTTIRDSAPRETLRRASESNWEEAFRALRSSDDPLWLQSFRVKAGSRGIAAAAVESRVSSVDRRHRASVVIEATLAQTEDQILRGKDNQEDRVVKVLQHVLMKWLFAFSLPTELSVLRRIGEVRSVLEEYEQKDQVIVENALEGLCDRLLAFRIRDAGKEPRKRYILHKEVRHYLAHQRGLSFSWVSGREWSTLTLSNVLMDREPLLSNKDFLNSCDMFSEFVEAPDREAVRSAYGLLRGNLFLSNVMRAGLAYRDEDERSSVLEEHLQRLLRLRACFNWTGADKAPLYPCDKVWIVNEIAVVCQLRGQMHDAILLWRELENNCDVSTSLATRCRIQLNLGACLIERGHFTEARDLFQDVESRMVVEFGKSFSPLRGSDERFVQTDRRQAIYITLPDGRRMPPEDIHPELLLLYALSQGYISQVRMLCAKLEQARHQIQDVLKWSDILDIAGLRGWLHYQASLIYAGYGDSGCAGTELELAMSLARSAQRPDLILSLETHEIDVQFRRSPPRDFAVLHTMLSRLQNCRLRASQLGSDKLQVATAIVRSRIMLTMSQTEGARESVREAICLSIRNGMRLRRVSGLTLFCGLMALRGETEDARKVLSEVRESAESMRYIRAVQDLDRLEHALKLGEGIQDWARNASDSAPYLDGDSRSRADNAI
jgi:hypothetical protein